MIRNRLLRTIVAAVTTVLPWRLKRLLLIRLFGYRLDISARIGYSLVDVKSVYMGKGARIGHMTVFRGLENLEIGDFGRIGNLNWITGGSDRFRSLENLTRSALKVGDHSSITNRHYIDCSSSIHIGNFTTIAGVRSQFLTHSIDLKLCQQRTSPIVIGEYCFVGTGCIVLPGAALPSYSVLGAGSVLRDKMEQSWALYAGVPAKKKKQLSENYLYFQRKIGYVR
jgi:acetyltransferase-like isoleucine patch superfamily enzyme